MCGLGGLLDSPPPQKKCVLLIFYSSRVLLLPLSLSQDKTGDKFQLLTLGPRYLLSPSDTDSFSVHDVSRHMMMSCLISGRKNTPVLLPGKFRGRRSLVGCRPWSREESDTTERLHFHFSLSCIGEGNGNPLQCSCLENPRDGGAWWAAVYGVAQSWT